MQSKEEIKKEANDHANRIIALGWHKDRLQEAIAGAWESGYVFGSIDQSPEPSKDVETAAKEYAEKYYKKSGNHFITELHFIAGAKWVEQVTKGKDVEQELKIYNTILPISNESLLGEYVRLSQKDAEREKEYSNLQDCIMSNICKHLKLYGKNNEYDSLWTASLFPERLTKAILRITEEYIEQNYGAKWAEQVTTTDKQ